MERLGVNCVFNPGAIEFDGKICLVARVEGNDRKSFFAIAKSDNGIDGFRFSDYPLVIPETDDPDINVYDMRLTRHEDGYIYGLFCTERSDPSAPAGDLSSAVAQCGIVRTTDMVHWERLPDLKTQSPQQRNVVLHPEFVDGKYAFYTRPQDGLSMPLRRGWVGAFGNMNPLLSGKRSSSMTASTTPLRKPKGRERSDKTAAGFAHSHGVRGTAAGLRYVIYAFLTDPQQPWRVTHRPGGFLIAPRGDEYSGDVGNVVFCNGAVTRPNGELIIYYASSDTRCHAAVTTVDRMLDYCMNTPEDPLRSYACVQQRIGLINENLKLLRNATGILAEIRDIQGG